MTVIPRTLCRTAKMQEKDGRFQPTGRTLGVPCPGNNLRCRTSFRHYYHVVHISFPRYVTATFPSQIYNTATFQATQMIDRCTLMPRCAPARIVAYIAEMNTTKRNMRSVCDAEEVNRLKYSSRQHRSQRCERYRSYEQTTTVKETSIAADSVDQSDTSLKTCLSSTNQLLPDDVSKWIYSHTQSSRNPARYIQDTRYDFMTNKVCTYLSPIVPIAIA